MLPVGYCRTMNHSLNHIAWDSNQGMQSATYTYCGKQASNAQAELLVNPYIQNVKM